MLLLATAAHIVRFRTAAEIAAQAASTACFDSQMAAPNVTAHCTVPPLPRVLYIQDPWNPVIIGAFSSLFHMPRVLVSKWLHLYVAAQRILRRIGIAGFGCLFR